MEKYGGYIRINEAEGEDVLTALSLLTGEAIGLVLNLGVKKIDNFQFRIQEIQHSADGKTKEIQYRFEA